MKRVICLFLLFAQFCCLHANDELMRFAGNIHQFNALFPQEKVYLQFDNTAYFQGDDIWFKAFVVKSSNLDRTDSGVLYVELLSPRGELLQQQKLKIVAGQADGCIKLFDTSTKQARELQGLCPYPSGYYEIRAYTQYMLNFDPGIIFSRVLPVYKTPAQEGDYRNPQIGDSVVFGDNRPQPEKLRKVNVMFFPEGGNLVRDLTCRVAFKATNEYGMGIHGKLVIRTQDGHKITSESGHEGMGVFEYNAGHKAPDAYFEFEGNQYSVTLPTAKSNGYAMMVNVDNKKERIRLSVSRSKMRNEHTIGVTVTCRGEVVMFKELSMDDTNHTIVLDTDKWPVGVCRIVLFTQQGEVLAARSIFNGSSKYVPPVIEVKTDKRHYDAFGKIKMSFKLNDKDGNPFRDRFCVSVRDGNDYGTQYSDNLMTDFLLTSDLKGFIHNPSYYFESADKQHLRNLDLLCMIQGWERYDWDYMTNNKAFKEVHRKETGLTLNGVIMTDRIIWDRAMDNVKVYVALLPRENDKIQVGYAQTESNGSFGFNIGDFYGKADLSVQLTKNRSNEQPNAKIQLQRTQLPLARSIGQAELQPDWSVIKNSQFNMEQSKTDSYPTVINEAQGLLLPTVIIDGEQKYVDYFTFKSFDVEKDVNATLDQGLHSTSVSGYLVDKGYTVITPIDLGVVLNAFNQDSYLFNSINNQDLQYAQNISENVFPTHIDQIGALHDYLYPDIYDRPGLDMQASYQLSGDNYFQLNGNPVICYVHDDRGFYVSGKFSRPWNIDTQDIESIVLFNDLHNMQEIEEYAPEYLSFLRKYSAVPSITNNYAGFQNSRMVLMDIKLKTMHNITGSEDRYNLGKRITTFQGFSQSYEFYSPEYPQGAVYGDVDYRRTLYWNPNVITNDNGYAEIEFYNNSYSRKFKISCAGITAGGMPYVLDSDL